MSRWLLNPKEIVRGTVYESVSILKMPGNLGLFTLRVFLHKFNDLHYLESQFNVEIIPQEGYDVCSILILIKNIPLSSPHTFLSSGHTCLSPQLSAPVGLIHYIPCASKLLSRFTSP